MKAALDLNRLLNRDWLAQLALSAESSDDDVPGAPRRPDEKEEPMDHSDTRHRVEKEVRFLVPVAKSQAAAQRITYGVVLEPETEDLQGDVMTAEDIEKAAYDWMERSQTVGHMHSETIGGATVVESYIAPCDIPVETAEGPETIRKGSWVLGIRWPESIWKRITDGELTGYSVGGTGVRLALEDVDKAGKWAPGPNAGWQRADGSDDAAGRPKPKKKPKTYHSDELGEVTIPEDDDSPPRPEDEERDEELLRFRRTRGKGIWIDAEGHATNYDPGTKGARQVSDEAGEGLWINDKGEFVVHEPASGGRRIDRPEPAANMANGGQGLWRGGEDHDAEPQYRQFTRGQKARDNYGKTHRVLSQNGPQVFVEDGGWIHPNNLWPVKKSDEESVKKSLTAMARDAFEDVLGAGKNNPAT